jgi:Mg/Co/Ni transporter MgtE
VRRESGGGDAAATLAKVLDQMENDIAWTSREMPLARRHVLSQMVRPLMLLLAHPTSSRADHDPRYVALHQDMTVEEAIAFLRATTAGRGRTTCTCWTAATGLGSVVNLRQLITSEPTRGWKA